jgi:hypothetical protein
MGSIFRFEETGTAALGFTGAVPAHQYYRLISVTCNLNNAPTTSENFTIVWNMNAGPIFDLLLYTLDPSAGSTTDILWQPDEELILVGGDAIDVAFANTDAANYGATITFKAV